MTSHAFSEDQLCERPALQVLGPQRNLRPGDADRSSADSPALDEGLPRAYTPEVYQGKVSAVFEHVYEHFPNVA